MFDRDITVWLLDSDVSVQYQVQRDLLKTEKAALKNKIAKEGWGARLLAQRNSNGHWGMKYYQPKWISSHYTLLELKNMCFPNSHKDITATLKKIIAEEKGHDGGILPIGSVQVSDVCVNGMFLNFASYFEANENDLKSVVDFILSQQLKDGGFNCRDNRSGAIHSSLHSTLSVIEGVREFSKQGYTYRLKELLKAEKESQEFLLLHKLFQSHRTGKTIDQKMLMLSYPCRWRYDILRALDYFRTAGVAFDARMKDALEIIISKQRKDKKWPLQAKHSGQTHFEMEVPGQPSRWNTLRALRVLNHFGWIQKLNQG